MMRQKFSVAVAASASLLVLFSAWTCSFASTIEYIYDESDRLRQAQYPDGKTLTYMYDNTDNRITQTIAYLSPPATGVSVSASPASSAFVGDNVIFTGNASGGFGTYEYQFWLYNGDGTWTTKKLYGEPGNTWTWNTGGRDPGTYYVDVAARAAGSTTEWEVFEVVSYDLQ